MSSPSQQERNAPTGRAAAAGPLRLSLRTMVLGGCLAMVYTVGIANPATTEFFRAIGAREWHFGLISGVPLAMLLFQFVGATALNRARRRKGVFIGCVLFCRLLHLGVAFLPFLLRERAPAAVLPTVILLLAAGSAAHNFANPFWFSWMADLIPRRVLNRVWGWRQRAMHLTWTAANLLVTWLLYRTSWPVTTVFPLLTVLAVVAGVSDVLLFLRVFEPPNLMRPASRPWHDLAAPLRHPDFSRFVLFSCCWAFATTFAASFMQLYVLKELQVPLWQTTLIWCSQGVGMAVVSGLWGRIADRHGQRPVIITCVCIKPMIVIVFFLLTRANVLWLLPLAFIPDGMLNSGYAIASNGHMLSLAPRENRSSFIASVTGLAGLSSGLAAMAAGAALSWWEGWSGNLWGKPLNNYHLLFLASLAMRLFCLPLARRIREPGASRSRELVQAILDDWPARLPRFPVGLYRRRE